MFGFDAVADLIKTGLDKWIPDANVREQVAMDLAKQAYAELELEVKDRDSARKREMETKDQTPSQLAWFYTIGYFANIYLVWKYGVNQNVHDLFLMLEGVMTAAQVAIIQYYFGSSSGGDKIIHMAVKNGNGMKAS